LAFSGAVALAADADGLVAQYHFDEGKGTAVADSSPFKNVGEAKGGVAWAQGVSGTALSFNGADAYVEVPATASLDLKNGTIEAWVFARVPSGGICFAPTGAWEDERFVCAFGFRDPPRMMVTVADGKAFAAQEGGALPLKQWCHVAATCDGTNIVYYLNGAVVLSGAQTVTPVTKGIPLTIGKDCGLAPDFFDGLIDEVSVYNRALTAAEVAQHAKKYAK